MRLYATTTKGLAVVLLAAGLVSKLDGHEAIFREIAESLVATNSRGGANAQPDPPTGSDHSALAQQWQQKLQGKKLVMMSSKVEIALNRDGTFRAYSESSVSIYAPGANGSSGGTRQAKGT